MFSKIQPSEMKQMICACECESLELEFQINQGLVLQGSKIMNSSGFKSKENIIFP